MSSRSSALSSKCCQTKCTNMLFTSKSYPLKNPTGIFSSYGRPAPERLIRRVFTFSGRAFPTSFMSCTLRLRAPDCSIRPSAAVSCSFSLSRRVRASPNTFSKVQAIYWKASGPRGDAIEPLLHERGSSETPSN